MYLTAFLFQRKTKSEISTKSQILLTPILHLERLFSLSSAWWNPYKYLFIQQRCQSDPND